jgi:hypothetical protein
LEIIALSGFDDDPSDLSIEFQFEKEEFSTEIIKKTINPEWNETFNLLIKNGGDASSINFKLIQNNKFKKIELGSFQMELIQLYDEKRLDNWFEFKKEGKKISELRLILQFTSSESGLMNYLSAMTSLEHYESLHSFLNELSHDHFIQLFDNSYLSLDESNLWKSILQSRKNVEELLKYLITMEIRESDSSTLFRSNSLATKLFTSYFRLVGNEYLQKVISTPLMKVVNENLYLEVDPSKALEGTKCEDKMKVILIYSKLFFHSIIESGDLIPNSIRHLLIHLENEVEKKFKDKTITAVSALVMLRFICPSIVTPQSYQLIHQ